MRLILARLNTYYKYYTTLSETLSVWRAWASLNHALLCNVTTSFEFRLQNLLFSDEIFISRAAKVCKYSRKHYKVICYLFMIQITPHFAELCKNGPGSFQLV